MRCPKVATRLCPPTPADCDSSVSIEDVPLIILIHNTAAASLLPTGLPSSCLANDTAFVLLRQWVTVDPLLRPPVMEPTALGCVFSPGRHIKTRRPV